MYLNKVTVIGNLTRDPELKSLPSGIKVTNMSIATNRVWKDQNGNKQEEVEYHNIVIFGKMAETSAQYLKKGSQALIIGRLKTQSWEDKDCGKKMYRTEIIAETVQFGSRPKTAQTEQQITNTNQGNQQVVTPDDDINPDDIPF